MEKYSKISLASFMVFVICTWVSYTVLPMNIMLSNVIIIGAMIALLIASFAFALILYTLGRNIFTSQQPEESADERRERNRIEMFELVSTDVETSKLVYVDKACNALEKIASASGDGSFDKADIMKAAVDFRERANIVRRHTATLVEARKNGHIDGVKELLERYTSDHLFSGFDDAVMNYLPESFHNANYLHVDEAIYGNYKVLKGLC